MSQTSADLNRAIALRTQGKVKEAIGVLETLLRQEPEHPATNYHMAWCHDLLGLETEAVPYYEMAISQGLKGEDLKGAYLGLGSTYRAIGQYQKSKQVFESALAVFPEDQVLPVFYALTLYNLQDHAQAMQLLLEGLCKTTSSPEIMAYKEALLFYSDKLDQTW